MVWSDMLKGSILRKKNIYKLPSYSLYYNLIIDYYHLSDLVMKHPSTA